jgi:predicted transcriptional regulator
MEKKSVVEAIEAGLRDVELGKVHTLEEALTYLEEQRKNHASNIDGLRDRKFERDTAVLHS